MSKIENMKNWMKEHKKEIAIGVGTVVVGGVVCVLGIKFKKSGKGLVDIVELLPDRPKYNKLELTEELTEMVEEISGPENEAWKDLWIGTVSLKDLGKFGEDIMKLGYSENDVINGGVTNLLRLNIDKVTD